MSTSPIGAKWIHNGVKLDVAHSPCLGTRLARNIGVFLVLNAISRQSQVGFMNKAG